MALSSHNPSSPSLCHVLHTMNVGGAEILAKQYALRAADGFNVVFACLDELGELGSGLRDAGFTVEVIGRKPGFDMRCVWNLSRMFKKYDVKAIHAHQYGPFLYSAIARRLSGSPPILFLEHGRAYPDYRRPKRVFANRFLLCKKDRVAAVGEDVRQALISYEGISGDRVEVVYNGIDLSAYDSQRKLRNEVRQELQYDDDDQIVIQVARLNHLKDHVTAIRAIGKLSQEFPKLKLLLAGDGEERHSLEQLINELNLEDKVQLLGSRNDVPRLLQAADMFLLSSISEGIPLTLIEAMASGLPCVSTDVGGTSEVIDHEKNGLLAEKGNPDDIADKLSMLLTDKMRAKQMAEAGYAQAHQRFSDLKMHQRYNQIYCEMLGISPAIPGSQSQKQATESCTAEIV
ncbi:MAG: glycosyltransferase [Blastopirellula sp.]|nr:MAG: glycosyltransferase [Blastopirellula sp.]